MPERTKLFNYNGLSHIQQDPQRLHLMVDTARPVQAKIRIPRRKVGAIREAWNALMLVISPGFEYRSTGKGELNYDTRAENLAVSRNRFFSTIKKTDPEAVMGMDPTITITAKGIVIEGLSANGLDMGTIHIPSSSYSVDGDLVAGTSTIEAGPDLVKALAQISAKQDLEICIGWEAAGDTKYIGAVKKDFVHGNLWKRDILQFLGASALDSNIHVRFQRIDLYNLLRHMRLNKPEDNASEYLRLVLIKGLNPELHLDAWDFKVVSPIGIYDGDRSANLNFYDQDKLVRLEPLLPFIDYVDVSLMGEALPAFWVLNSQDVSYTYSTMGYKFSNWARGLYRDQILRRDTPEPEGMSRVLSAIKTIGLASVSDLLAATSMSEAAISACLVRAVQNGVVAPNAGVGGYVCRELFPESNIEDLVYSASRDGYKNEARAYTIVEQGRVNMSGKLHVKPNGSVDFARLNRNKQGDSISYSTEPVSVSQEKMSFQSEDPVFYPKLQLNVLGATRKPGCTCAYMNVVGKGAICSHIQALWIHYCREEVLGGTTGIRSLAQNTLVKVEEGRSSGHRISIRGRRIVDEWGSMDALNAGTPERRVRLFQKQEDAYSAFLHRIAELEAQGFTNAG